MSGTSPAAARAAGLPHCGDGDSLRDKSLGADCPLFDHAYTPSPNPSHGIETLAEDIA